MYEHIQSIVLGILIGSVCLFPVYIVEWLVRWVASRINHGTLKSVFYWSMFCISRFASCDLAVSLLGHTSVLLNGFQSDESIWHSIVRLAKIIAITPVSGLITWLFIQVIPVGLSFLINTMKQRNDRKEKGIYFRKAWMWPRHIHPSFDSVNFSYDRTNEPCTGFKIGCSFVTILDNNRIYDPAWPNCSIVHSIMVFMCNHCTKDNGLHILRTSLYRRQTRTLWSHPLPNVNFESIDQLKIYAFESNGLVLISMVHEAGHDLLITDLRCGRMIALLDLKSLFPSPFFFLNSYFFLCYAMWDNGSELGDRKNSSSIYLRLICFNQDPGGTFCYGQSLVEVPLIKGSGSPQKLSWEEHSWSAPWTVLKHGLFRMSLGRVGIRATFHHPVNGDESKSIIWDPNRRKLLVDESYEDLINTDLPLRLFTERYPQESPSSMLLLNDKEVIVMKNDGSILRTSFQPPSLKSLCLKKIFGTIGKKLDMDMDKFTSQDWLGVTGVDANVYFEGKKT